MTPSLIFISDQFLFEAERVLSQYFDRKSKFWYIYRDCIQETTRAIVQVDRLQQFPHSSKRKYINGYVRVNALFTIGPAAVCLRERRMKDFVHIKKFIQYLSVANQILDDFQDIVEDLQRKRYNYAAVCLLRVNSKSTANYKRPLNQMLNAMVFSPTGMEILEEVQIYVKNAFDALEPIGLPRMNALSRIYQRYLADMQNNLHTHRVKIIFNKTLYHK